MSANETYLMVSILRDELLYRQRSGDPQPISLSQERVELILEALETLGWYADPTNYHPETQAAGQRVSLAAKDAIAWEADGGVRAQAVLDKFDPLDNVRHPDLEPFL